MRRIKVVSHGVGNGLRDELLPEPVAFLNDAFIGKPQCGDAAVNVKVMAVIDKSRLGISGQIGLLRGNRIKVSKLMPVSITEFQPLIRFDVGLVDDDRSTMTAIQILADFDFRAFSVFAVEFTHQLFSDFCKIAGVDPDVFLSFHPNWQDCSLLPTSSRESEVKESSGKKMEDPEAKGGVVGLFCRAYPIREAIDTFLSNVYEPSANIPGRYSYIPADSSAGVQIFEEKFAHSFHASDPACGRSLNSFDLVRVHKFGDEDEKKSFQAMCDFAMSLDKVKVLAAEEKKAEADMDFDDGEDWREKLRYMPRSKVLENSVFNEVLILNNDLDFQNFAFNEMANRIQITGEVPWNRPDDNKFWRDADTAQLKAILDTRYTSFSTRNHDVSFLKVADDRSFHPVRDYLDGLPSWDGKERVDTLLIKYFDADDTPYVRAVTRKMLVAAVTRIYHPGTKFDSVPVLDGEQGIGKSTFLKDLCGEEYYADNLSLTDMNDKAAAEKLQGFWIVEIPELAGMKKADIEKVKAFITTTDDKYRPSYGRGCVGGVLRYGASVP